MHAGKLVFSQLMEFLPWRRFDTCVRRYGGDHKIKTFPCSEHLRVMAFAQLTYRESLRDIETCLRAVKPKVVSHGPARWRLAQQSVERQSAARLADLRRLRPSSDRPRPAPSTPRNDLGLDLDATVYALDASTIDLCLSMFPWAKFRQAKGAVKMHTLLNLQGNIPEFILISDGKLHDVNVLDYLVPAPGAYYVMDRGYLDFARSASTPSGQGVLRHPSQEELQVPTPLLPRSRQNDRRAVRPNGCFGNVLFLSRLSRAVASDSLLRSAHRQAAGVLDQRLRLARHDDRSSIQISLDLINTDQLDRLATFLRATDSK